ncbi:MAG: hypothetical protein IPH43_14910 [Xanthomonadales bacterium]|nr:hypothetical protein [Xanthomonadales bacterium]
MIVFDEDAAYNVVPLRDLSGEMLSPAFSARHSACRRDTIRRNGFD